MSRVAPAPSRIRVVREVGRLGVLVRSGRLTPAMIFPVAFLAFWLTGWAFGEVMVIRAILRILAGETAGPVWFLAVWLMGWTVGGAVALYSLAYAVSGREQLWIDRSTLRVRCGVGPIGRTRRFDLSCVERLRAEPMSGWQRSAGAWSWPGANRGEIAFDYGARTYRIGGGLEGTDLTAVLELLRERLPQQRTAF